MADDPKNSDFRNDFKAAMDSIHEQNETLSDLISKMSGEVSALLQQVTDRFQKIDKEKVSKDGYKYTELGPETLDPKNDKSIFGEINAALKAILDQSATNFKTINMSITKFCDSIMSAITGKKQNTEGEVEKPIKLNLTDSTASMLPAVKAKGEMQRADSDNKQNALTKDIKEKVDPKKPDEDKKDKKPTPTEDETKKKLPPRDPAGGTAEKKKKEAEESTKNAVAEGLTRSLASAGGKTLSKVLIKTGLMMATLFAVMLVAALLPHMDKVFPLLKQIGQTLIEVGSGLFEVAKTIIGALVPLLQPLGKALVEVGKVVGTVLTTLAKVLAPPLQIVAKIVAKLLPLVAGLVKAVGWILNVALKIVGPVLTAILKVVEWGVDAILGVGKVIGKILSTAWKAIAFPIKAIWAVTKGIFTVVGKIFSVIGTILLAPIKIISSIAKGLFNIVRKFLPFIGTAVRGIFRVVNGIVSGITKALKFIFKTGLIIPLVALLSLGKGIFRTIGNIVNAIGRGVGFIFRLLMPAQFMSKSVSVITKVVSRMVGFIGHIAKFLTVSNLVNVVWQGVKSVFGGIGKLFTAFKKKDEKDDERYAKDKIAKAKAAKPSKGDEGSSPDFNFKENDIGSKVGSGLASVFSIPKDKQEQLANFFEKTKERTRKLGEFFKTENIKNLQDKIKTRSEDLKNFLKNASTIRLQTIRDGVQKRIQAARELAQEFADRAKDVANFAMTLLKKRAPWLAALIERRVARAKELASKIAARAKDVKEHAKALALKATAWFGNMRGRIAARGKELASKLAARAKDVAHNAMTILKKRAPWLAALIERRVARAKELASKFMMRKKDLASHTQTLAQKYAASASAFAKEQALRVREKAETARLYLSKKLQRLNDLKSEALAFAKKKALALKDTAVKAKAFVKEKVIDRARQFMRKADLRQTIATSVKKNALAAADLVKEKGRAALDIAISGGKAIAKMVASLAGLGPLALLAIPIGVALIGGIIALAHRKAKTSGDSGGGSVSASVPKSDEKENKPPKPKANELQKNVTKKLDKAKELKEDSKLFKQKFLNLKALQLMRKKDLAQQKSIMSQSSALKKAELGNERAMAFQNILTKGGESIMNTVQAFSSLGLVGIPLIPVGVAGIAALIALAMRTAKLGGGGGGGGAKMPKISKGDKGKPDDLKPPSGPDIGNEIEQQKLKELKKIRKLLEQQVASQNGTQGNTRENADTAKEILAILPTLAGGGGGTYYGGDNTIHDVTGSELSAYRKHYLHIDTNISRKTIPA